MQLLPRCCCQRLTCFKHVCVAFTWLCSRAASQAADDALVLRSHLYVSSCTVRLPVRTQQAPSMSHHGSSHISGLQPIVQAAAVHEVVQSLERRLADSLASHKEVSKQLQQERESTQELSQQAADKAARLAHMEGVSCRMTPARWQMISMLRVWEPDSGSRSAREDSHTKPAAWPVPPLHVFTMIFMVRIVQVDDGAPFGSHIPPASLHSAAWRLASRATAVPAC